MPRDLDGFVLPGKFPDYDEARCFARGLVHEFNITADQVYIMPADTEGYPIQLTVERMTLEKIKLFARGWAVRSNYHNPADHDRKD